MIGIADPKLWNLGASDAAIKAWLADKKQDTKRIQEEHYKQLTIFDILEEVAVC